MLNFQARLMGNWQKWEIFCEQSKQLTEYIKFGNLGNLIVLELGNILENEDGTGSIVPYEKTTIEIEFITIGIILK